MVETSNLNLESVSLRKIQPNRDEGIEEKKLGVPMGLPQIHLKSSLGDILKDYGRYQKIIG